MNQKDECDVVKNLAIQHLEGTTSEGTERFIQEHFETCESCRKYYAKLATQLQEKEELEKDEKVLNQFKKVNKRMVTLKGILFVIITIFTLAFCIFSARWQIFAKVVNTSYAKMKQIETLDNYKVTIKTTSENFKKNTREELTREIFYKDGKWKEDNGESIAFYYEDRGDTIRAFRSLKQKDYTYRDFILYDKHDTFGSIFSDIQDYKSVASTIYAETFGVRSDTYNGTECYVIRFGSKASHRDTWIDKETMIPVRLVVETIGEHYTEEIFTFEENVVTDEDVDSEILNQGEFKEYTRNDVMGEMTEDMKLYLELREKARQKVEE